MWACCSACRLLLQCPYIELEGAFKTSKVFTGICYHATLKTCLKPNFNYFYIDKISIP